MHEPLISIIIPVLNGSKFLERCFSTLEKQTYSNLEIIFIDNGSSDDTKVKIESYCYKKKGIKLLNCSKLGPGAARNVGIKYASGEYISFLDVDDELLPEKHNVLMEGFNKYPEAGMVVGKAIKQFSDGRKLNLELGPLKKSINHPPLSGILWLKHLMLNPVTCSYLVRSEILQSNKIRFSGIPYGEDIAFNVLVGLKNNVLVVDKLVCTYHRHSQSSISIANQNISSLERYFQFYEKFALPYFYERRDKEPFNQAFKLSERITFRMLMKLIFSSQRDYHSSYRTLTENSLLKDYKLFYRLFSLLPYKYASYLFDIFHSISAKKS